MSLNISMKEDALNLSYLVLTARRDVQGEKGDPITLETFKKILSEKKVIKDEFVKEESEKFTIKNYSNESGNVFNGKKISLINNYLKKALNLGIINKENVIISDKVYNDSITEAYQKNENRGTEKSTSINIKI